MIEPVKTLPLNEIVKLVRDGDRKPATLKFRFSHKGLELVQLNETSKIQVRSRPAYDTFDLDEAMEILKKYIEDNFDYFNDGIHITIKRCYQERGTPDPEWLVKKLKEEGKV